MLLGTFLLSFLTPASSYAINLLPLFLLLALGMGLSFVAVTEAAASVVSEHEAGQEHNDLQKGSRWVFSEVKNEAVLSHFYCITSCLVAHCLFGRFFFAVFPLYSGGSDARLWHPR